VVLGPFGRFAPSKCSHSGEVEKSITVVLHIISVYYVPNVIETDQHL